MIPDLNSLTEEELVALGLEEAGMCVSAGGPPWRVIRRKKKGVVRPVAPRRARGRGKVYFPARVLNSAKPVGATNLTLVRALVARVDKTHLHALIDQLQS